MKKNIFKHRVVAVVAGLFGSLYIGDLFNSFDQTTLIFTIFWYAATVMIFFRIAMGHNILGILSALILFQDIIVEIPRLNEHKLQATQLFPYLSKSFNPYIIIIAAMTLELVFITYFILNAYFQYKSNQYDV